MKQKFHAKNLLIALLQCIVVPLSANAIAYSAVGSIPPSNQPFLAGSITPLNTDGYYEGQELTCFPQQVAIFHNNRQDNNGRNSKSVNVYVEPNLIDAQNLWQDTGAGNVLHVFSHGRSGELLLGGEWRNAAQIANWLEAHTTLLRDKQHLNIYGCEFAKEAKGQAAVAYLEKELGITVAASTNITGRDGDWILEVGHPVAAIAVAGYQGNLQSCVKNLVFNNGFEDYTQCPDLSTSGTLTYATYWGVVANSPQLMVYKPGVCASNAPASPGWDPGTYLTGGHTGTNWGGGHTSESWAVTLTDKITAGAYRVCFWGGWVSDKDNLTGVFHSGAPMKIDITDFTGVSVGTATSETVTNRLSASNQTWVQYCVDITTTGDGYKIKFAPTGSVPSYLYMDDASLMSVDPACCDALSSPMNLYCDYDGDSIINENDLDDDNDGILDEVECITYTPWSVYKYDRANTNHLGVPVSVVGSTTTNTTISQYDITYSASTVLYMGKPFTLVASNVQPDANKRITVTLTATATNSSLAPVLADVFMVTNGIDTFHIDNSSATGFSTLGTWTNQSTANDFLGNVKFASKSVSNKAIFTFSNLVNQPVSTAACDIDGDNIPNHFDTDSDGDGCPDAIEGGGSFTYSHLTTSNNLCNTTTPSCVDANGIPTIATAAGQTRGDSQNAIVQGADCVQPDNDGDGVADSIDIDDDNDGILDVIENGCLYGGLTNVSATANRSLAEAGNEPPTWFYPTNLANPNEPNMVRAFTVSSNISVTLALTETVTNPIISISNDLDFGQILGNT